MAERDRPEAKVPANRRVAGLMLSILAAIVLVSLFRSPERPELSYTEFKARLEKGDVASVTVSSDQIAGEFKPPPKDSAKAEPAEARQFRTTRPPFEDPELMRLLEAKGVTITAESQQGAWWFTLLIGLLPWLLILGFFFYSSRIMQQRMGGGQGGLLGFARSRAKLHRRSKEDTKFTEVAGLDNAKKDLREIIDYLKNPSRFQVLGAKLPKGVLLMGPPGTGKTLLAKASAGEANVPFFSISGSEFIEMFVGVGASRVRDMFNTAKRDSPSIIFIDEIDSIGRARGTGLGGGHDEREQTLNQILAEMDGFSPRESVVVMAATNRPDVLDPALTRPGRFDRQITLELPQREARRAILEIHTSKLPLGDGVDLEAIAKSTVGFSGADLENLANEAALIAGRKKKGRVEADDFDAARDKIVFGSERSEFLSERDKKIVAHHEAGHTLLAFLLPGADPVRKVSIIPRGRALGATEQMPEEDQHNLSSTYLLARLAIMLGGRVAEKITFNDVTTGAADDLKQATRLARRMVCQWGMSERLGPVYFRRGEEHMFLGREIAEQKDFSDETARVIDEEIQKLIQEVEKRAETVLTENFSRLKALAEALLERETLGLDEIRAIVDAVPARSEADTERTSFERHLDS